MKLGGWFGSNYETKARLQNDGDSVAVNGSNVNVGNQGQMVRVISADESGSSFYVQYRNGNSTWIEAAADSFSAGEVLLIVGEGDAAVAQKMPDSAWPEELRVGVIKIKLHDLTVIDSGGRWQSVKSTSEPDYEVGNTVQFGEFCGVVRILSEEPLRLIEFPEIDKSTIESFKWRPGDEDALDFSDFGGLREVVDRAKELIELTLDKREELAAIGTRPIKGVLFTGQPGTGKTMLARIIASKSGAHFYKISGPEVFNKWFGRSEELLRELFAAAAKDAKDGGKSIIFFDEIDSVAPRRGDQSHEASKRVVAQLLTLMDGFSRDENVIVIAATNRPSDLDAAIRRPGRFDWEIEFPLPSGEDREDILSKSANRLKTSGDLPHAITAANTEGWSSAELVAIWSEASLMAVKEGRSAVCDEDMIGGFERIATYREKKRRTSDTGGDL